MFIEFQVGNFRSFRDVNKFSMQASPLRTNDSGLEEGNVFENAGMRLLRTKAIYGANASGKSNLSNALANFILLVMKSVVEENLLDRIWSNRFHLISEWDEQPVFFQYIFSLNDKILRYGFQVLKDKIEYEWLYEMQTLEDIEYFMRGSDGVTINDKYFSEAGLYEEQLLKGDNELFRSDALFLTSIALSGNTVAKEIRTEITNIKGLAGINDSVAFNRAVTILDSGTELQKKVLKDFLCAADTGIEDLQVMNINNTQSDVASSTQSLSKTVFSVHSVYDENGKKINSISVPFDNWESLGTKKLLGVAVFILDTLRNGTALIVDEFDARFHPNLTLKIVQLFQSEKSNPNNAQLIFITHDSSLLRRAKLRRDQICFVLKDKYGISNIKTLIEYKGVRKDASYDKEYLEGNYDGIAYLDELDQVVAQNLQDGV